MRINFHGAARTVTGSQHLIEVNGSRLLLECGLFQGRRQEAYERNRNFPFDPRKIDAAILSHAHIDHSGNLPNLIKHGYDKPIYATPATAHLADMMLRDSGHIQEADVEFVNKVRARRGEPPVDPLYTQIDAAEVAQFFQRVQYGQPFEPIPGVTARLVDAGHILGSAAIVLESMEKGRKIRLWFSGDIGRRDMPIIRDPILPDGIDYLIMESTYGDKPHPDPQAAFKELRQVVMNTVARQGKVIIPAFAVGRTQELIYGLNQMIADGDISPLPVYVDSPLAVNTIDQTENREIDVSYHNTTGKPLYLSISAVGDGYGHLTIGPEEWGDFVIDQDDSVEPCQWVKLRGIIPIDYWYMITAVVAINLWIEQTLG